jgi:hypothetical protein
MTGGVAKTVSRRHAPDSQSRRRGIRRGLMMALFILGAGRCRPGAGRGASLHDLRRRQKLRLLLWDAGDARASTSINSEILERSFLKDLFGQSLYATGEML